MNGWHFLGSFFSIENMILTHFARHSTSKVVAVKTSNKENNKEIRFPASNLIGPKLRIFGPQFLPSQHRSRRFTTSNSN